MTNRTLPTYFISHGGGPWPWMADALTGRYAGLAAALRDMPTQIGRKPRAVLMVSAHWEEPDFTVMAHPQPPMLYDYSNFPEHTYRIRYPASGDPQLATEVKDLLERSGIATAIDSQRGFDHGMFSPMAVIYPEADVPTVQLSLKHGLDLQTHLALGRALAPLRDEDVLIVGSGLSYHNLRMFGEAGRAPSAKFDAWLSQTLAMTEPRERSAELARWELAPAAREAHPREEHLLPLMVALGAAEGDGATRVYHEDSFGAGLTVSSYRFG